MTKRKGLLKQHLCLQVIKYNHTSSDVHIIQQQLNASIQNPVIQAWVNTLAPDMLEVAARMVQHWGVKQDVLGQ